MASNKQVEKQEYNALIERCAMSRVLNVAAMVVSVVVFLMCGRLNAAVVNITEGSTSGYTMTDGNTYVIQNSVVFSNVTAGCSGLSVESNSTVVIYVPKNVTLTATGANGEGRIGGGAGICVPSNATLVVTGEGMIVATGGNAGNGGKGMNGRGGAGGDSSTYYGGAGGAGGTGGGGAGAAIGGVGGAGGISGSGAGSYYCHINSIYDTFSGANNGGDGGGGDVSGSMGRVFVIGRISMQCTCGDEGTNGNAGVGSSIVKKYFTGNPFSPNSYHIIGDGGGGGGGGAGASPECPIGAGGLSGGGGGGGGSGAIVTSSYSVEVYGEDGLNGQSKAAVAEPVAKSEYGGEGGAGGAVGAEGGAGELYVSSTAVVDVERAVLSAETHTAAQYMITFDANGGTLSSEVDSATATLGCGLPDCIPAPVWQGYLVSGWKDDNGTQYYGGDGTKMLSSYSVPSSIVLHAEWVYDPAALVIIAPDNGTTFEDSLTISMSSLVDGATIYYTVDGSEPTIESTVYRKKFRIYSKTTIKAIAVSAGLTSSDAVVASYAPGRCANPVISLTDGAEFAHSNLIVSIRWKNDGVLRYTLDGTDPTAASPIYEGPFTFSDSVELRAKVFSDDYFDSAVVTSRLTRVWENVATPQIDAADSFTGSKAKVVITCATEGATIRYTLDGSEPDGSSAVYAGPIYVTDSCTVKVYAVNEDYLDSAVATQAIVKEWDIGDSLGKPDHGFTTDGSAGAGWMRFVDATAPNGEAMKSGAILDSQQSVLETKVTGSGTLTFSWRTSCEDSGGQYDWDHVEFAVDGTVLVQHDGINSWTNESVRIVGEGEHVVTWTYKKDEVESDGDDAAYVAGYGWVSDYTETQTTEVPVPYAWLTAHDPGVVDEYEAYEASAKGKAANGRMSVAECYVVGLDPEIATNEFKITSFPMKADGTPDIEHIVFDPPQERWNVPATYKVKGAANLNDTEWPEVTEENKAGFMFFKVTVELP